MTRHPPFQISHLYLNESLSYQKLESNGQGNYLLFWWKSIVLGHVFLEPNELITKNLYYQNLIQAIKPTLEFYAANKVITNWEKLITTNDTYGWVSLMEYIFSDLTSPSPSVPVPISVIICTRNRADQLLKCLQQLKDLEFSPSEIIVVDNAPSDNSSQQVVQKFIGVTYIEEPRGGLDIARNTGIKNATNSIIAFIDDDVVIHPLWAYQVWETFQNQNIDAMTGLVLPSELKTEAQYLFEKHWSFNRGFIPIIYDIEFIHSNLNLGPPVWKIGAGANMAFKKSVFEKTGFFDEILDAGAAGCNGDSEMWFRLLIHGCIIKYNPKAIVYHEHRRSLSELKNQMFSYMQGFTMAALLQQRQYPEALYKNYLLKILPDFYLKRISWGFPRYRGRNCTLWMEIKGLISGYVYYLRNQNKTTILDGKNCA